jgi:hypothetical protein
VGRRFRCVHARTVDDRGKEGTEHQPQEDSGGSKKTKEREQTRRTTKDRGAEENTGDKKMMENTEHG